MTERQAINIVWFKRDLRLQDHRPLQAACQTELPTLLMFIVEPSQLQNPHLSLRHWRFIHQSIKDINQQLGPNSKRPVLAILHGECVDIMARLHSHFAINTIFSHQEIGDASTFQRDKDVHYWCQQQVINWQEFANGAVIRGCFNRDGWDKHWQQVMRDSQAHPNWLSFHPLILDASWHWAPPSEWCQPDQHFQCGGPSAATAWLESFFVTRGQAYSGSISSPSLSREHCSRLSPYLAFGNLSVRQVYQHLLSQWQRPGWRRSLRALSSRLHWHCHFMQKFESECSIEFRPVNSGYDHFPYRNDASVADDLTAWQQGRTGFPLVDACMRCLHHTGYINFRMRAMLVSFLTHHMSMDWREGVTHLAQLFLDFEPGIHYSQFQMQAGVTGINTIRIYNPIKQAQEHDSEGEFVKKWVPELEQVPTPLIFEPWKMTPMEAAMYQLEQDSPYLGPIFDLNERAREARERLWSWKKRADVKSEGARVLARHVRKTNKRKAS